jgi:hypothetical protein
MIDKRKTSELHRPRAKAHLARLFLSVALLSIFPKKAAGHSGRVNLSPKLQAGQTLGYQITYRGDKQTKTQSSVALAEVPAGVKINVRARLRLEVLGVASEGQRSVIHARTWFESLDSDGSRELPNTQRPANQPQGQNPKGIAIEFTIFPDGRIDQLEGLDALPQEQQHAWQQWAARFAAAAVFPQSGIKVAQKWKSQESEQSPSPIARLTWMRESTYVRNEPCRALRTTIQGDLAEPDQPPETCAVILTTATLKQHSSPKDATPDDFSRRELRTTGTARGSNQTITYISLKTGLVVRASDEADQTMSVTIAKADGSNRVHYDVQAKSNAEILLVVDALPSNP